MDIDEQTAVTWVENNVSSIVGDLVNADPEICSMVAESGACGWGMESFETVTTFSIERNRCGFVVAVNLSADPIPERFCMFSKARAGLCGSLVRYSRGWELDNVEVLSLTRDEV